MRGAKKYLGYGPLIAALNAASAASREVEGSGGRLGAMIDGKNRLGPKIRSSPRLPKVGGLQGGLAI
jgi:hypothetical protein